jgi:ubiquinone/menaquinone biosynthesis C-methylase UbiE
MEKYDKIGLTYSSSRRADARITQTLMSVLNLQLGANVADIGAGTGNYSHALANRGLFIFAVEPSKSMILQSARHDNIRWYVAKAEKLPFKNGTMDGIIAVLSIHHFTDLKEASKEMIRVCPSGRLVIFTCDPRLSQYNWLSEYFPEIISKRYDTYDDIFKIMAILEKATCRKGSLIEFPIPHDIIDKFAGSGWRRPEIYLIDSVRNSMSPFALAPKDVIAKGLLKLRNDMKSGAWVEKHGYILNLNSYDLGYRFIKL